MDQEEKLKVGNSQLSGQRLVELHKYIPLHARKEDFDSSLNAISNFLNKTVFAGHLNLFFTLAACFILILTPKRKQRKVIKLIEKRLET